MFLKYSAVDKVSDIQSLLNTVNEDDAKGIVLNEYLHSISNIKETNNPLPKWMKIK